MQTMTAEEAWTNREVRRDITLRDFDVLARGMERVYVAAITAAAGQAIGLSDMVDILAPGYVS